MEFFLTTSNLGRFREFLGALKGTFFKPPQIKGILGHFFVIFFCFDHLNEGRFRGVLRNCWWHLRQFFPTTSNKGRFRDFKGRFRGFLGAF